MAKAAHKEGFNSILLNKVSVIDCEKREESQSQGIIEGIKYYFLHRRRKNNILSKIIAEVISNFRLMFKLRELSISGSRSVLIVSYSPLFLIFYYKLIAWLLRYRFVISIMEYHPELGLKKLGRINAYLFWKVAFFVADGAIPISRFLSEQIRRQNAHLPLFEVPVLADFNHKGFTAKSFQIPAFFLYCGSVGYFDVIKLVVDAYLGLEKDDIELHLVISGKESQIKKLKNLISNHHNIKLYQKLSYDELYSKYAGATGLLIPMRSNQQDLARFPQKIAEYAASGSPIITNPVGEIDRFFKGNVNAVFADGYSVEAYKNSMLWILNNPDKAKLIGRNGKTTGFRYFHFESIEKPFADFLKAI